jgi:hypothetical protein
VEGLLEYLFNHEGGLREIPIITCNKAVEKAFPTLYSDEPIREGIVYDGLCGSKTGCNGACKPKEGVE